MIAKRTTTAGARYDVRFRAPDGKERSRTFRTKKEAEEFERSQRTDLARGVWIDPRAGQLKLGEFGPKWLEQRYKARTIRATTFDTYEGLWRLHIAPALGSHRVSAVSSSVVREWHAELVDVHGANVAAKAYRLLRSIMSTAVEDGLVMVNPCAVKGAGVERPPERPIATLEQVFELADAMPPERRMLVLLAAFTGLRIGELLALTRRRVDPLHGVITVREQLQRSKKGGGVYLAEPKTDAGKRTVAIPPPLLGDLEAHLAEHAAPGPDGLLFPSASGGPAHKANVAAQWRRARHAVGLDHLHFHDLRHTGNTLAAATGASTKELMARMGHASSRAALIYQHATADRDRAIADALGGLIDRANMPSSASVVPLVKPETAGQTG